MFIEGFPGGSVVKNPPANAEDTGSTPGPGRSHMRKAPKPMCHNCWACAVEPESRNHWATRHSCEAHVPSSLCSATWEATTVKSLHTGTSVAPSCHTREKSV